MKKLTYQLTIVIVLFTLNFVLQSCEQKQKEETKEVEKEVIVEADTPEYFLLRPEVEKAYGYSHAVKIGNSIKISGAVSMDDAGNPTAIGDLRQQMKNCYSDLEKILIIPGFKNEMIEIWSFKIPISPSKAGTTTSVTSSFERKDFSGLTISTLNSSVIKRQHLSPSSLLFQ